MSTIDGSQQLNELCNREGASPERIRASAPFLATLPVTQIVIDSRYNGDMTMWANAAFNVIDCITAMETERILSRKAARFMRACLGLDAGLGGYEARLNALVSASSGYPTSLTTLRAEKDRAMTRLANLLSTLEEYPCGQERSSSTRVEARVADMMRAISLITNLFFDESTGETDLEDVFERIRDLVPKLCTSHIPSEFGLVRTISNWDTLVRYITREVYTPIWRNLAQDGYVLLTPEKIRYRVAIGYDSAFRMGGYTYSRISPGSNGAYESHLVFAVVMICLNDATDIDVGALPYLSDPPAVDVPWITEVCRSYLPEQNLKTRH